MKKSFYLTLLILHLSVCCFLSFDWSFLEGEYMGFGITFILLYLITVPGVIAFISVTEAVCFYLKKSLSAPKLICGVLGLINLSLYILSALRAPFLPSVSGAAYALLLFGTVAIIVINTAVYLHSKRKKICCG